MDSYLVNERQVSLDGRLIVTFLSLDPDLHLLVRFLSMSDGQLPLLVLFERDLKIKI